MAARTGPSWPAPFRVASRMPDLSDGLCQPGKMPELAGAWESLLKTEREAARHACQACPVLTACRAWAVTSGPRWNTHAIIAGMGADERRAARRTWLTAGTMDP